MNTARHAAAHVQPLLPEVTVDAGRGPVRVRLPAAALFEPGNSSWPLVVFLPGYTAEGDDFDSHFGNLSASVAAHEEAPFDWVGAAPSSHGIIEVIAEGRRDARGHRYWAAWGDWVGDCRPNRSSYSYEDAYAYEESRSAEAWWLLGLEQCDPPDADVAYLRALVAAVARRYPVDPARVAALGHSNGAAMAYRLACEAADLFRAVVVIAGSPPPEGSAVGCRPTRPVRLLHIHGTDDSVVLFGGRHGAYDGAVASVGRFLGYNNCSTRALPAGASLPGWSAEPASLASAAGAARTVHDLSRRVRGADTEAFLVDDCLGGCDVSLWKLIGEEHTPLLRRAPPGSYPHEVLRWLLQRPHPHRHPPSAPPGAHPWLAPLLLVLCAGACCCFARRHRRFRAGLTFGVDAMGLLASVAVDVVSPASHVAGGPAAAASDTRSTDASSSSCASAVTEMAAARDEGTECAASRL